MPIQVERRKEQRCQIFTVSGSFAGVEDAMQIRTTISDALAHGQRNILVNIAALTSIDDFGIESLLACGFMTSYADGSFRIFGAQGAVRTALIEADARGLFSRAPTEEDAIVDLRESIAGKGSAPFDILEFVREEEERDGQGEGGLKTPQMRPSES